MSLATPDNTHNIPKPPDTLNPPCAADLVAALDYVEHLRMVRAAIPSPVGPSVDEVAAAVDHAANVAINRRPDLAAPGWFKEYEEKASKLVKDLEEKIDQNHATVEAKLTELSQSLLKTDHVSAVLLNYFSSSSMDTDEHVLKVVPLENGNMPGDDLPPLTSLNSIRNLTHAQLDAYITHYSIPVHGRATFDSKRVALARSVGCIVPGHRVLK